MTSDNRKLTNLSRRTLIQGGLSVAGGVILPAGLRACPLPRRLLR